MNKVAVAAVLCGLLAPSPLTGDAHANRGGPLHEVTTYRGLTMRITVPQSSYPAGSLVRIVASVQNTSRRIILLQRADICRDNLEAEVLTDANSVAYPPAFRDGPHGGTLPILPSCGPRERPLRLKPGHAVRRRPMVVLRGEYIGLLVHTVAMGDVRGPVVAIRLTASPPPKVVLERAPSRGADIIPPAGARGRMWYTGWSSCDRGPSAAGVEGTVTRRIGTDARWEPAASHSVAPQWDASCIANFEWHALAGWIGFPVADIRDGTSESKPYHPGATIAATANTVPL